MQDRQFRIYFCFLTAFCLLLILFTLLFSLGLTGSAKTMLLSHDETIASSLIEQGVSKQVIAKALTAQDTAAGQESADFLLKIGIRPSLETRLLPQLSLFQKKAVVTGLFVILPVCLVLLCAAFLFLRERQLLYLYAGSIIEHYIANDYQSRLPQTDEGAVYQMFSSIDKLATMLRAQNETAYQSKIFLKNTISDISHQLKTPLAALSMYQEIMENEPDNPAVIQMFTAKTALALKRMEQLIGSMLKITRLDAGNITFRKQSCHVQNLIAQSVNELTTRATEEHKTIVLEGSTDDTLLCDPAWTGEAVSNLIKNALDHTSPQDIIRITWDMAPFTTRIQISDNGEGIPPEDIHHIFKRFYRGSASLDTPGIGLGLPLAKSIVEGQGGTISVQSTPHAGTTFTLLFNHGGMQDEPDRADI